MDDEKLKEWNDELQRRREAKNMTYGSRRRSEDRVPDEDSCYVLSGGKTRHGNPCLRRGMDKYGGGCPNHRKEPVEGYVEELTTRPQGISGGLKGGDRWKELERLLAEEGVTLDEFVSRLTPEELARGQIRAVDGSFRGAPPKWVPRAFMQACVKELMRRGRELYQTNYVEAIRVMLELAYSPDVEGNVRLRAAQFVIERIEGKTPEKFIVETKDSFAVRVEELEAEINQNEQLRRVKERLGDKAG